MEGGAEGNMPPESVQPGLISYIAGVKESNLTFCRTLAESFLAGSIVLDR